MADKRQRVTLVTGATDGIGKETARVLATRGHFVIVHGRSAEKVAATCTEISNGYADAQLEGIIGDFNSLEGVRKLAEEVKTRFPNLNVLVNNAGVLTKEQRKTADGFELHWGVNHVAPCVLTMALLDTLRANTPSRIVMLSSVAHLMYGRGAHNTGKIYNRVEMANLNGTRDWSSYRQYSLSKLGNVMFAQELHRQMRAAPGGKYDGVTVTSLHPGIIGTKLLHAMWLGGDSVNRGAQTSIQLADDAALEGVSGVYYSETKEADINPIAKREADLKEMWDWTVTNGGITQQV